MSENKRAEMVKQFQEWLGTPEQSLREHVEQITKPIVEIDFDPQFTFTDSPCSGPMYVAGVDMGSGDPMTEVYICEDTKPIWRAPIPVGAIVDGVYVDLDGTPVVRLKDAEPIRMRRCGV